MVMRPDRFTESAQEVLGISQTVVQRFRHSQWDVEHVFLALLEQQDGLTGQILEKLGVGVASVRERVETTLDAAPKDGLREHPDLCHTARRYPVPERGR